MCGKGSRSSRAVGCDAEDAAFTHSEVNDASQNVAKLEGDQGPLTVRDGALFCYLSCSAPVILLFHYLVQTWRWRKRAFLCSDTTARSYWAHLFSGLSDIAAANERLEESGKPAPLRRGSRPWQLTAEASLRTLPPIRCGHNWPEVGRQA